MRLTNDDKRHFYTIFKKIEAMTEDEYAVTAIAYTEQKTGPKPQRKAVVVNTLADLKDIHEDIYRLRILVDKPERHNIGVIIIDDVGQLNAFFEKYRQIKVPNCGW